MNIEQPDPNENITLGTSAMPAPPDLVDLYQNHFPAIHNYLTRLVSSRVVAEDLSQDTFVKALQAWPPSNPQGRAIRWLYQIATNTARDYLRRKRRITMSPLLDDYFSDTAAPTEAQIGEQEAVRTALAGLPPSYQVVLILHEHRGYRIDEVAGLMDSSVSAVKSRLFRARRLFREAYMLAL